MQSWCFMWIQWGSVQSTQRNSSNTSSHFAVFFHPPNQRGWPLDCTVPKSCPLPLSVFPLLSNCISPSSNSCPRCVGVVWVGKKCQVFLKGFGLWWIGGVHRNAATALLYLPESVQWGGLAAFAVKRWWLKIFIFPSTATIGWVGWGC